MKLQKMPPNGCRKYILMFKIYTKSINNCIAFRRQVVTSCGFLHFVYANENLDFQKMMVSLPFFTFLNPSLFSFLETTRSRPSENCLRSFTDRILSARTSSTRSTSISTSTAGLSSTSPRLPSRMLRPCFRCDRRLSPMWPVASRRAHPLPAQTVSVGPGTRQPWE